jgi:gamma-glutamyltranspeptidase/glutathione hydrolase
MLNLLEPLNLRAMDLLGPERVHVMVQAKQIAYHDRDQMLADPAFADVPVEMLISKDYARKRRALIDPKRALSWDKVPSFGSLAGHTVYLAAADRDGNAVSLIQSLYGAFGSCTMAGRTGVVLQNRSAYFSLDPQHPNCLAQKRQIRSTRIDLCLHKLMRGLRRALGFMMNAGWP